MAWNRMWEQYTGQYCYINGVHGMGTTLGNLIFVAKSKSLNHECDIPDQALNHASHNHMFLLYSFDENTYL